MSHLTRSQRDQIQALKRAKHTQQEIADIIGCDQSTISREVERSKSLLQGRYTANTAQRHAEERRYQSYNYRTHWWDNEQLRLHVEEKLKDGKSPDQIAGRIKRQGLLPTVSHQSIYAYVERDKENGGNFYTYLRNQGKKYKWRGFSKNKSKIPNRKGIEERPEIVNRKERIGDWESDLVVSDRRGSGAVATFAERKSMYFRASLVTNQSASEMVRASNKALGDIPEKLLLTMTHDNGKEITKHEEITRNLKITVYCARPYRSCDRGLNEFMNRELRRFFPKGTDFSKVTQKNIDIAVEWLNNCPRRSLDYRTPREVFEVQL